MVMAMMMMMMQQQLQEAHNAKSHLLRWGAYKLNKLKP